MITLYDNLTSDDLTDEELTALVPYAGVSLATLSATNPQLLIFPEVLGLYGDSWQDECLYQLQGNHLVAGNVVGFFSVNGVQLQIHSRFDRAGSSQYFLHYMLQHVFGGNLLNVPALSSSEPIWDFLVYLFPYALKQALSQGILRLYRFHRYNDSNVRGSIDLARHISHNVPFNGCIAYHTRELTANNALFQLVRLAMEAIKLNPMARALLTEDEGMIRAVATIRQLTPDFNRQDAPVIIAQNLRPIRHPFYGKYTLLQKLCLQILRHEKVTFGSANERLKGLVFKAEWLWEEYLNSLLQTIPIKHAQNTLRQSPERIFLYHGGKTQIFPDFFNDSTVLDAKYKRCDRGIQREDRYQLISYVHVRRAQCGILLYPWEGRPEGLHWEGTLNGWGGRIGCLGLAIPSHQREFKDFQGMMEKAENSFLDSLRGAVT